MSEQTRADLLADWQRLLAEHRVALQEASQERTAARHEGGALVARAEQAEAALEVALEERDDAKRWLNDAGRAYSPCEEHQPDAWEGDGTCVICEGQRLSARVAELEAALRGMLGVLRGRVDEHYTHVMVRADDFNAGVAALVPEETAHPSSADSEAITPHAVAHLALTRKTGEP